MRKSSVGSAVLGLLAVTVASIGATGVLMLLPFPNDRALFGCAGAIFWLRSMDWQQAEHQGGRACDDPGCRSASVVVGGPLRCSAGMALRDRRVCAAFCGARRRRYGQQRTAGAGAGLWQCAVFTAGRLEPTAVEKVQIEIMMKKGTAVPNCGSFCTLRYLTVKKLPYSGSLRME